MTKESDFNHLWDRALQYGSVFSSRRLKSLFVKELLRFSGAQVRKLLARDMSADYQSFALYAQALEDTRSSIFCQVLSPLILDGSDSELRLTTSMPKDQALSVNTQWRIRVWGRTT